jgi:hypothetical protein
VNHRALQRYQGLQRPDAIIGVMCEAGRHALCEVPECECLACYAAFAQIYEPKP